MSSLTVRKKPWAAFPTPDTTIEQLARAVNAFGLEVVVTLDGTVYLGLPELPGDAPPNTDALAEVMYAGADPDLLVAEETGEHQRLEEAFEAEAKDRHEEGV